MKKFLLFLLGISNYCLALEQNPIAPPNVEIADRFGVNMESGQLARRLNTVSIGGELGLSHNVQLYTDLWADGYYGFVDAFAGSVTSKKISDNIMTILTNPNGNLTAFRDTGEIQRDSSRILSVMRAYGPVGSQDFLVYQNGVVDHSNQAATGYTYRPVGDTRHSLTESTDKKYLIWITPDGIESKYERSINSGNWVAGTGANLREVTYPNGFKVRVYNKGVTTNTGFMLKYHFSTVLPATPSQIVALNLAQQYCAVDAAACATQGWPTATFTWPTGTPNIFITPGIPASNHLIKLTTNDGVTEIQYQPENLCITNLGYEDAHCSGTRTGLGKWSPRLKSIKTTDSTASNYQYTYKNIGTVLSGNADGYFPYWYLSARVGQITNATMNGTDTEDYNGPTLNPGTSDRNSGEIMTVSARYEPNVLHSVRNKKTGFYVYHQDLRKFVEKYYPVAGRGPDLHYYYEGPRGNLNKIHIINSSGSETLFQEASYSPTCDFPKTCNKPLWVKDARGNVTNYDYDPQGRFSNPIKITAPADKNGNRAATIYNYEPKYAYYKRNGEAIAQDPDPVWMLTSEHTCRTFEATSTGCMSGNSLDMVKTSYYYGPQSTAQANNLLLRGKSIVAEGSSGALETRVWCYEYDKYGKLIGETLPKGNSTTLESCQ
ncbi:MAG: hypothetical protein Q7T74_06220 [Candidatus Saccharibacteria bacterium]|nr:hypothetical protein [Candidatus Saccharibacteria bacterium]